MTARHIVLSAIAAVLLLVVGAVLVDYLIVTEEELVADMLHNLATELEANDSAAVLQHISVNSSELRQQARRRLAQVVVHQAIVKRNLKVTVSTDRNPPVAVARFNAVFVLSDRQGMFSEQTVPRYLIVNLRKEDDQWRISRYEDLDPIKRR